MPFSDDVNRVLRDHEGYTGPDGQYPLPIGDWTTARKPIDKKDLRQLFHAFDESAGAAQEIIAAAGAVAIAAERIAMDAALEVTVGPGGQFPTVNAALAHLSTRVSRRYQSGGLQATIRLRAGFIMAEQVIVSEGLNLGWITIVSTDAEVPVDPVAITTPLSAPDSVIPIFGARDGSVMPVIGAKFAYPLASTAKDGVAVMFGSRVRFLPGGNGVVRARNGLKVLYGSEAVCYVPGLVIGGDGTGAGTTRGVDFSYAANRALHVAHGSRAFLARGDFRHAGGDMAVYVIWKSHADLYQSSAAHAAGTAYLVRDDSTANCRESEAAYAGGNGYHAVHLGRINARSRDVGVLSWVGEGARGCGGYAVLASDNSSIAADSLDCDGCQGSAAVSASAGSTISFYGGKATNSRVRGIWCSASRVAAEGADVSGSGTGIVCEMGGHVVASNVIGNTCANEGVVAFTSGEVIANNATFNGCRKGAEARGGARINLQDANLRDSIERGISVIDGGEVNCMRANTTGALSFHLTVRNGGIAKAYAYNGAIDLRDGGGIVFNATGTGATSQPVNTPTANGVIYR